MKHGRAMKHGNAMSALASRLPRLRARIWPALALAALMAMECTGASLWYQALFRPLGLPWTAIFAVLLAILSASCLLLRRMEALHWSQIARAAVFLLWLPLAAFVSLKLLHYTHTAIPLADLVQMPVRYILRADVSGANFFHILLVLLLAWRGVALARGPVSLSGAQAGFQVWLVLLLLYGMGYGSLYPREAVLGLYLFLFFGLVALSAARLATLSDARGGRVTRFGPGWLVGILLSALALVGLAVLLGWMAGSWVVEILAGILVIILALLTALALLLLSPLLVYLAGLLPRLADLIQQLLDRLRSFQFSQQLSKLIQAINEGLAKIVPYVLAARGLVLAGLLIVLVVSILLALYLRGKREETLADEERGEIEPGQLDNPLQKLLNRLLRGARSLRPRDPRRLLAAARIRMIYRRLMALCKKLGAERAPSATPLEFVPVMAGLMPGEEADLSLITEAYVKVRYGEYPESREAVEAVERAWARVKKMGKKGKGGKVEIPAGFES